MKQSNVAISGTEFEYPFITTRVTYLFEGLIRYHQLAWSDFQSPTMDLLPGNYTFRFVDAPNETISISGCTFGDENPIEPSSVDVVQQSNPVQLLSIPPTPTPILIIEEEVFATPTPTVTPTPNEK